MVVVKRVSAYPINADVEISTTSKQLGQVIKVSQNGCLIETMRGLPLGTSLTVTFTLPLSDYVVKAIGIVVKVYTRHGGLINGQKAMGLNEIQLKSLKPEDQEAIVSFLNAIKKKAG
jgi:hypothetical protein